MFFVGFDQLKFFNLFSEYFLGIMLIYVFVVFVLLSYNIFDLVFQNVTGQILSFVLFLSIFFLLEEMLIVESYPKKIINCSLSFVGFNNFVSSNSISLNSKVWISVFSVIYVVIISNFLKDYKISSFEYLFLILFAIQGLLLLCCTNDLLSTFLAIELVSLSSYCLSSFRKSSSYSIEAGIKYLVVGAVSSSFFLLGSSFIYGYLGTVVYTDIHFLTLDLNKLLLSSNYFFVTSSINIVYNFFIEIGIILILISLFIKLALAPFHGWSIDVYEGSPSISSFFFSTISKLSFFIFLYRFCFITFYNNFGEIWLIYNLVVGFLSVIIGSFGGLKQKKLKSLLAYSSISHMGYCLLAITSFSKFGFEMFFFYIISYILTNIVVWYVILSLKKIDKIYKEKTAKDVGDLFVLSRSNKVLSFSLCLSFFSLAGIPPLLGFLAKLGIFLNLILENFYLLALITILCGTISTFYYLRIIKILYFENLIVSKLYFFNSDNVLIFCFLVFLLLFLFIKPTLFYILIHKMLFF